MAKLLKIFLLLIFITSYELRVTSYELFAQDKIVAIVNNDIITQKDLNDFINVARIQFSQELEGKELESKIQSLKLDLLNKLIEDRLILQEAKKENVTIDESRVKLKIDEIKKRYASDAEFQGALSKQGLVQSDIESKIREQLLMYSIVNKKVRSRVLVSPNEITDFYERNKEKFILPVQRELEVISIKDAKLVAEVVGGLKKGQALEDLIAKYSLEVDKMIALEDGSLRKDIEEVIFKLNPNEISSPVKVEDSYYIFRLDNIIPSRPQSLTEAHDKILAFLSNEKMQEELTKWLDELKKKSYIKILQN